MRVGAGRDWDLEIYPATWRTGETGVHLRFSRGKELFLMFLGRDESRGLVLELEKQLKGDRDAVESEV